MDSQSLTAVVELFKEVDSILGVLEERPLELSVQIRDLIDQREQARGGGDFRLADQIRNRLFSLGVILEDTKEGVRWKRKRERS